MSRAVVMSRSTFVASSAALVVLVAPIVATGATLTFDDLPLGTYLSLLPGGYGGLAWAGVWNVVPPPFGDQGVAGGLGPVLAVSRPVESAPGSCCVLAPFDFLGADFAPYLFGQNPLNVAGAMLLRGSRNGQFVYSMTAPLAPSGYTSVSAGFFDIDSLEVQPISSSAFSTGYPAFAMDNFAFDTPGAPAAPVPEPGTLPLIGAGVALFARRRARTAG